MSAECGRRIVEMVWDDLTPARLLSRASFDNAIACAMAMGCSTNAIIHLIAMSRRAGHAVTLDDFDAASRKVPVIANIRPSGERYLMEDFFYAGGLPALLQRMRAHLHTDAMTVNGRTLGENIARRRGLRRRRDPPAGQPDLRRRRAGRAARQPGARRRGHQAQRLRAAPAAAHRPRAGVRRLSGAEEGGRRPGPGRHGRRHPGAAQRRPARAPACPSGACCRSRPSC